MLNQFMLHFMVAEHEVHSFQKLYQYFKGFRRRELLFQE